MYFGPAQNRKSPVPVSALIQSFLLVLVITFSLAPAYGAGIAGGGLLTTQATAPVSAEELLRMLKQIREQPSIREVIVSQIESRGIGFDLTEDIKSDVRVYGGGKLVLAALEKADARRRNPAQAAREEAASILPSPEAGRQLLEETRIATLQATEDLPDFIVRQQVSRSFARGESENWIPQDNLMLEVTYEAKKGERYKVLNVNGLPPVEVSEGSDYAQLGGSTSTGEFALALTALFSPETRAQFHMQRAELLKGRPTVVYTFTVSKERSRKHVRYGDGREIITAYAGWVWIDREQKRVLRMEDLAVDLPPDFPITHITSSVDYDFVRISEQPYLLPVEAEVRMKVRDRAQFQTRNRILFRGYRKFEAEIRTVDDIPEEPKKKPGN